MSRTTESATRNQLALACRVLAHQGLSEDILGHVSVRHGEGMLIRCRGEQERGLLFTTPDDILPVSLDGEPLFDDSRFSPPKEWPIHAAVLSARPDVHAVIHAHPPWIIALDLAGIDLVPLVGAYDIPAARLAADGIPVHPRSVLIDEPALAAEMLHSMGHKPVCILRGHGITSTGPTVEAALSRALAVQSLARMSARVVQLGGVTEPISDEDLAQLPDLGSGFNDGLIWNHCVARLEHDGHGLTGSD